MSDDANAAAETTEATTEAAAVADAAVTTEAKPEGEAAQEQGKTDGAKAEEAAAEPFALKAPEGAEAYQGEFDKFAGDMDGWLKANPNATAREALTEAASRQAKLVGEGQADMQKEAAKYEKQVADWGEAVAKEPEFSGEHREKNIATAIKAVEKFGGEDLRQRLTKTGLGNHPGIVKAFFALGKDMADTEVVTGQAGTSTRGNFASALYGNGNGKG